MDRSHNFFSSSAPPFCSSIRGLSCKIMASSVDAGHWRAMLLFLLLVDMVVVVRVVMADVLRLKRFRGLMLGLWQSVTS